MAQYANFQIIKHCERFSTGLNNDTDRLALHDKSRLRFSNSSYLLQEQYITQRYHFAGRSLPLSKWATIRKEEGCIWVIIYSYGLQLENFLYILFEPHILR